MKEILWHIANFNGICLFVIIPLFTVFTVQIVKRYTNITKAKDIRCLSWIIATIYWALYVIPNGLIENYFFLNIFGPGIICGMISNGYYDAFTCED